METGTPRCWLGSTEGKHTLQERRRAMWRRGRARERTAVTAVSREGEGKGNEKTTSGMNSALGKGYLWKGQRAE